MIPLPIAPLFCDRFQRDLSYMTRRPRGSNDWLLIFTQGGAGRYKTRQGSLVAYAGAAVLYAPGDFQDYATSPDEQFWDLTWVHFLPHPHWEEYLRWPLHSNGLRYLNLANGELRTDFQLALARMLYTSRRTVPKAFDLAANALEEALLWAYIMSDAVTRDRTDERVRRAANYLSINLKNSFQLDEVAADCSLSVSRLSHLFKIQIGVSPQQFHERQRLQHAAQLLRLTGLSVAEVAQEVGFSDPFYFSNRFRRAFGKSPLQFRRSQAEETCDPLM